MKKHITSYLLLLAPVLFHSCATPAIQAKEQTMPGISRTFDATPNDAYYAVRWALKTDGYNITKEDLDNGIVVSSWLASKVDSFYIDPFGPEHKDYGVNGAYYKLEVKITPDGGKTRVEVVPHVKCIYPNLKSSHKEEKRVLKRVADYLRKPDINVTNIGIEE